MSVFNEAGLLIIGTRLKRLGDRFLNEVTRVYKNQDIRFETSWFPIFFLLHKRGSLSLTEIAAELDVSHSAISQMITQLQSKKLVEIQQNVTDARIKKIVFSAKGKKLTEQLHPVWEAFQKSLMQVLPKEASSPDFLNTLSQMEEKLSNNFLSETTLSYIHKQSSKFEIVEADSTFRTKLFSWLSNECIDSENISDSMVVALNGHSIKGYTSYNIVDDCILLKHLYVSPANRRKGIALQMVQYLYDKNSLPCFLLEEANLDLIRVLIKSGYSFKVK